MPRKRSVHYVDNKKFLEAPNEEERRNEPRLRNKATYTLQWQTFSGSIEQVELEAGAYVDEFLAWLDGYNETFKGQSTGVESEGPKV